jgi:K+-sensing histidine kinase KdpD
VLEGEDVAEVVLNCAKINKVTQISVMRHRDRGLSTFRRRGLVLKIVALAHDMRVTVVANRSAARSAV